MFFSPNKWFFWIPIIGQTWLQIELYCFLPLCLFVGSIFFFLKCIPRDNFFREGLWKVNFLRPYVPEKVSILYLLLDDSLDSYKILGLLLFYFTLKGIIPLSHIFLMILSVLSSTNCYYFVAICFSLWSLLLVITILQFHFGVSKCRFGFVSFSLKFFIMLDWWYLYPLSVL